MAKRRKKQRMNLWKLIFITLLLCTATAGGMAGAYLADVVRDLPPLTYLEPQPSLTSTVYARDGTPICHLHGEQNRIPVPFSHMPQDLIDAFVAVEDHLFWEHRGIDPRGILRALYVNVTTDELHGGSTITQQLAKNAFLSPERTLRRKIQEAIIALQLERCYTKEEILEMYLNQIPFGHGQYGVQAAARFYFGKDVQDLTLAECALLAGIARAPAYYSPYVDMDAARTRQAVVLQQMVKYGYITHEEAEQAKAQPIKLAGIPEPENNPAPYFVDYVLAHLLERHGKRMVYEGGLKIYTTLDPRIQEAAEAAVKSVLDPVYPLDSGKPYPQAAVVVMDARTGEIVAMVGGRTHTARLAFNRAVEAYRQPGSAFKPVVVYTAAFELGYGPASVIDDAPVAYEQISGELWTPENYDHQFRGLITLREALVDSVNVAAVKLLDQIGIETGWAMAEKLGITSLVKSGVRNDHALAIALGGLTKGVTPLEMTQAYGVLANRGVRVTPYAVIRVVDRYGNVLEENRPIRQAVISEETAYLMTDVLRDVIEQGTGTRARLDRPAAGKTGTTSEYVDAWFIGYTPQLVCTVWMGYDQPRLEDGQPARMVRPSGKGVTGGSYPAMIWREVMIRAHEGLPVMDFHQPPGIVRLRVCAKSGLLPGPHCPAEEIREEMFVAGKEPTGQCDVHVLVRVCKDHPEYLAGERCPETIERVCIRRREPYQPAEDGRVPLDANLEVPKETCPFHQPPAPEGETTPTSPP